MNQEPETMRIPATVAIASLALFAAPLHAQHGSHGTAAAAPATASAALSEGEVRRIDKGAGKITLKHGPLANLDMPPMTMTFDVRDRAALDKLQVGDKVRFRAEKDGTQYVVTRIEK
jgi:Cu/Ag efflux protein CusF